MLKGGQWVRVAEVWGFDQLGAYDEAVAMLPADVRDNPAMFRVSQLCPPGDGTCATC